MVLYNENQINKWIRAKILRAAKYPDPQASNSDTSKKKKNEQKSEKGKKWLLQHNAAILSKIALFKLSSRVASI